MVVFSFNYLKVVFLYVPVTKGAQFDPFDWPRTVRSQVSTNNIDALRMSSVLETPSLAMHD